MSTEAWTRKEGKNPKGGLNAKGRASYKKGTLKAPVKSGDNPRRASFLSRMAGNSGPERDSKGKPNTLSDTCIHRGGSLSGGVVREDCIQCPYHGWRFNGEGSCERIPSLGKEAKIPKRARVDANPTEERYGIVFAFLK